MPTLFESSEKWSNQSKLSQTILQAHVLRIASGAEGIQEATQALDADEQAPKRNKRETQP